MKSLKTMSLVLLSALCLAPNASLIAVCCNVSEVCAMIPSQLTNQFNQAETAVVSCDSECFAVVWEDDPVQPSSQQDGHPLRLVVLRRDNECSGLDEILDVCDFKSGTYICGLTATECLGQCYLLVTTTENQATLGFRLNPSMCMPGDDGTETRVFKISDVRIGEVCGVGDVPGGRGPLVSMITNKYCGGLGNIPVEVTFCNVG